MDNKKNELCKMIPLWLGQLISLIGSSVVQFGLIWYITEKSGSTIVLSIATMMTYIPMIFLGTYVGSIVDKLNKKVVMVVSDGLSALTTFAFFVLLRFNISNYIFIYLLFFIKSIFQLFQSISMLTVTSKTLSKENLSVSSGINQVLNGISSFAAPIIGALLIKFWEFDYLLLIEVGTALFAIILLFFFKSGENPIEDSKKQTFREQIGSLRRNKSVFSYSLLATFMNLVLSPSLTILPILVSQVLLKDATILAAFEICYIVGIIIGGFLVSIIKIKINYQKKIIIGSYLFSIQFLVVGIFLLFNTNYYIYYCLLFLLGVFFAFVNSNITAFFQTEIEQTEQGVIFGAVTAITTAAIPLGLLIEMIYTKILNVQYWYLFVGIFLIIVVSIFLIITSRQKIMTEKNIEIETNKKNERES